MDGVTAAESRMTGAATVSSAALERQERAQEKARESARKLQAEIAAVAQPLNAGKVAAEGFGKAFTLINRAAYLLPGFGFAGILLAIGNAASWMAEQFTGGAKSTAIQDAALREYTRTVEAAAAAVRDLGRAQAEAGRSTIGGALGIDPRALSGGARLEGARLEAERAKLTQEQKRLDTEAGAIAAAERSVLERGARLSEEASRGVRVGQFGIAAALQAEAETIGRRRRLFVEEAGKLRDAEVELSRRIETVRRVGAPAPSARASARDREAPAVTDDEVYSLIYGGRGGFPGYGMPASMGPTGESNIAGPRSVQVEEGLRAMRESAEQTRDAFRELGGGFSDMWTGMVESATNAAGMVSQAVGTLTTAVGGMMTNMIISGEAGAKGLAKAAGNALAGISAQAYGYSVLLAALAAAAALSGPILGWQAGGLASAAGVMAAAGTGLAVTARLLGADKLGASSSARSAASGGGGGGYGAATATNPYGGQGQQGTTVQVFIDSEQVAHSVRTRERRMALAGGIMGGA